MILPSYKRPFEPDDFRGYFKWTKKLSNKLKGNHLYHACHQQELLEIIEKNKLTLRSKWSINLPEHGLYDAPGVWCGLNNYFVNGNYYGPFLVKFSLSVLEGRQFMVFRRSVRSERDRYFFVQYDAMIPIYSFKDDIWRQVKAEAYFQENNNGTLQLKKGGIYDVVITDQIQLDGSVSISYVNHKKCISGKCNGGNRNKFREFIRQEAKKCLKESIIDTGIIEKTIKKFPDVEGEIFEIVIE